MDTDRTDPVESSVDDGDVDLYEVATWEERSRLDGFAVALYRFGTATTRGLVILLGLVLLFGIGAFSAVTNPVVGALTVLSAVPAVLLAGYVYVSDVTTNEPPALLLGTFLLSVVTATFAAVLNGATQGLFAGLGTVGFLLFFYLFVGPVEETVKLLAVRLYAYRDDRFGAVVDGAVYGAMAGLGFAFIENALYIERGLMGTELGGGLAFIAAGSQITLTRALAGPGHVIYSAFAGYYLGLAKFNNDDWGPIVIKGLVIASLIHATYNSTVGLGAAVLAALGLPELVATFAYILLYDALFGALLLRKIDHYRRTYERVEAGGVGAAAAGTAGEPTDEKREVSAKPTDGEREASAEPTASEVPERRPAQERERERHASDDAVAADGDDPGRE